MTAFSDQPWSRSEDDETGAPAPRRTPLSPGAPAEPLIYQTQQRVPGEPGMFRPRRPHPGPAEEDPTQAMPAQDAPQYRRRDFSPEGRRAVPSWAPAYAQGDGGYPSSERLDYQTLGHQEVRAAVERSRGFAAPSETPAASEASLLPMTGAIPMSTPEQPLTRRQLRALREQQERDEQAAAGTEDGTPPPEDERPAFVDSAAPATFAVPVQPAPVAAPDSETAAALAAETADERLAAALDSAPTAWDPAPTGFEPAPTDSAPPPTEPAPAASDPAPAASDPVPAASDTTGEASSDGTGEASSSESLDDWMAKVFDAPAAVPGEATEPSAPVALVEPPEPEHWEPGTHDRPGAPSVFDALFTPPSPAEPAVAELPEEEPPAAVDPSDPLAFLGAQPRPSDRVDLPAPGSAAQSGPEQFTPETAPQPPAPEDAADPTAEEIVVEEESPNAPVDEVAEVHPVVLDARPVPAEPVGQAPAAEVPTGHWSQQAAADDDAHSLSRDVAGGHGAVTTNALVLPSIPQQELSGPLANTGEILITGSIDLPRSLSSTGAHPTQLDESRLDHELDPGDQQVVSADSQPIRAIRAVSTHTSTRGMMLNTKPKGNRSLTVLIIVTGALALAVGAVLVVGLLSNAF
ncbi:MAG: hypothetical protein HY996_08690 [Micrococcales bacterium]|nr:hypothetical protein [Micrococcales bacterium]